MRAATVPGQKRGTYDALATPGDAAGLFRGDAASEPTPAPHIRDFLFKGVLPKALSVHAYLLTLAVAGKLPKRDRPWVSSTGEEGKAEEDPNSILVYAANAYLLLWKSHQDGKSTEKQRELAKKTLEIITLWAEELSPYLALQQQIDAWLSVYQKSASVRTVR